MPSLMSLGTRAMFASYAALQATGHNISNAGVDGYSRQSVKLETSSGQFTGAGFYGRGVDVSTVSRAHNEFLTKEAAKAQSLSQMDATHLQNLKRLENLFPPGEQGIGQAASQFFNALSDMASKPADPSARQVVLSRAGELAARFSSAGSQVEVLQAGVKADLRTEVASINGLAANIAQVNDQLAQLRGVGHDANDLLDRRDQLVNELSGKLAITTMKADDGTLSVFIAGGQRLVLGSQPSELTVMDDALDPSRATVGIWDNRPPAGKQRAANDQPRELEPSLLGSGGSVAGLLRFQNEDLTSARNDLGRMAAALAATLNEQQHQGLDLGKPAQRGQPLFQTGAPRALPASTNKGGANVEVTLTNAGAQRLEADEYELHKDPAQEGRYLLTRRSDGQVFVGSASQDADGKDVVTAFKRQQAGVDEADWPSFDPGFGLKVQGSPAATDRFLVQPVGTAAAGMRLVLDSAQGLAAASPLVATGGVSNAGTATVASLQVKTTAFPDASQSSEVDVSRRFSARIEFGEGGAYTYSWKTYEADGTTVATDDSITGQWQGGQPLVLNGYELNLNGTPSKGDTFDVLTTPFTNANNGNALSLAALRDERFVGRQARAGASSGGQTIVEAYAAAMADVGVRVQGAQAASNISGSVASTAKAERDSKAGVNLDEEAAKLIQYQQGYQAAAKVLQVAQAVFDTLLRTTGG